MFGAYTRRMQLSYSGNRWIVSTAIALLALVAAATPSAQTTPSPLTNGDVVRMVNGKLSEPVMIAAIENAWRWHFDLTADGLIALNRAGVPDAIIIAMLKVGPGEVPERGDTEGTESAPSNAAPMAVRPREPGAVAQVYRVDPATGELMPLEGANTRKPVFGFQGVYIDGPSSSATFPFGEPHAFTLRSSESFEKLRNQKYELEYLAVRDGKRYVTKLYVPLDIENLGPPKFGMAAGRPYIATQSYLFTPRTPLRPGQYAFTRGGVLDGGMYGTFAIVER